MRADKEKCDNGYRCDEKDDNGNDTNNNDVNKKNDGDIINDNES